MRILISGSHGLIGSALVTQLQARGDEVVRLVREPTNDPGRVWWNPHTGDAAFDAFEGYDAIIHLAGRSIGERRWSEAEKARIASSRIVSTQMLAKRINDAVDRPSVFLCASAIGIYGDRGDEKLTEESSRGKGFLADLVDNWEAATEPIAELGIRVVNLRSGIVFSSKGGALAKQIPLFRLYLGGRLGSGQQYLSWISLEDEVAAIIHAIDHRKLSGPVNMVSPQPVKNVEFTHTFAEVLHRKTFIPVFRWMMALPLGGQLTDEMLLASQRVTPTKLKASGFKWNDVDLEKTLERMTAIPEKTDEERARKRRWWRK